MTQQKPQIKPAEKPEFTIEDLKNLIMIFSQMSFNANNWREARAVEDLKNKTASIIRYREGSDEKPADNKQG